MLQSRCKRRLEESRSPLLRTKAITVALTIKDILDAGMVALVPKGDTSGSEKKGIFNRSLFKYDSNKDVYICPANEELEHRFSSIQKGMTIKKYLLDVVTCRTCKLKSQCSNSKGPRRISRWEHQGELDHMDDLMASMPDSMLIRKQTVEHPFGTIKAWMGATHFLTRGFKRCRYRNESARPCLQS
jgi:hypothetical protein